MAKRITAGRGLAGRLHQLIYGRTARVYRRSPAEKIGEITRARRGESVREIAARVGRAPGTVRRWLRSTQTPSAESQAQLDAELRRSLRDQRRGVVERITTRDMNYAGNLHVRAETKIMGDRTARTRTWTLGLDPDQLDALDDAAARGDDAAVTAVIEDAIADYIGGGDPAGAGESGSVEWIKIEWIEIA